VVGELCERLQAPLDFAHLEHLIGQKHLAPSQEPDVARILPSSLRSTTIVTLSVVASLRSTTIVTLSVVAMRSRTFPRLSVP
jgi:hypothetical protein